MNKGIWPLCHLILMSSIHEVMNYCLKVPKHSYQLLKVKYKYCGFVAHVVLLKLFLDEGFSQYKFSSIKGWLFPHCFRVRLSKFTKWLNLLIFTRGANNSGGRRICC